MPDLLAGLRWLGAWLRPLLTAADLMWLLLRLLLLLWALVLLLVRAPSWLLQALPRLLLRPLLLYLQ